MEEGRERGRAVADAWRKEGGREEAQALGSLYSGGGGGGGGGDGGGGDRVRMWCVFVCVCVWAYVRMGMFFLPSSLAGGGVYINIHACYHFHRALFVPTRERVREGRKEEAGACTDTKTRSGRGNGCGWTEKQKQTQEEQTQAVVHTHICTMASVFYLYLAFTSIQREEGKKEKEDWGST